ncbi:phage tail tape measure protein [Paenibacillus sp. CMAA1364]
MDQKNPVDHMEIIQHSVAMTRRRLQLFRMLIYGSYGCIGGLVLSLVLLGIARIWPIANVRVLAIGLWTVCVIIATIYGSIRRIHLTYAAKVMDELTHENERSDMMVTALSFHNIESVAVHWQREQAAQYGQQFTSDRKKRLPLPRRRKLWIICGSLVVMVLILSILPNPQERIIAEAKQQEEWINNQEKQVNELAKKLQLTKLNPTIKQPLEEQLETLEHDLKEQKDPAKVLDQLEKTMKAIAQLAKKEELKEKSLMEMAEQIKRVSPLTSLAKSLQNHSKDQLKKATSDLKNEMRKLSLEEKEKIREALNKLTNEMPANSDNQQVKDSLKQLEQALEKGSSTEQDQALQQLELALSDAIEAKMQAMEQVEGASALNAALAQQGLGLAEQMATAGLTHSDTWSRGGNAEQLAQAGKSAGGSSSQGEPSKGPGTGSGQGSSSGSGEGQGNGSGSGQGNGNGLGSDNGNGSESGSGSGSGGNGSQGAGIGSGSGSGVGSRDLVTTPRSMAGKDGLQTDGGSIQGGGGDIQKGGTSPMMDGASRPYEEVYEDYAAEAKKTLNRSQLPRKMQGLVESYFTAIHPN